MKIPRNPVTIHPPLAAYTQQIELQGPQRWLVLSGQVGLRLDGSMPADPMEQLAVAWENLEASLQAAGMTTANLVKLTIYLVGEWDAAKRREFFKAKMGANPPCLTLLYVPALVTPAYLVELDAWAAADA